MNIVVYLASTTGTNPKIEKAAIEFGQWMGACGHTLIYGGSSAGLMGILAKNVLDAGGKAIGIEPQFFIDTVPQLDGLTELIPTVDMKERKAKMIELGDAFVTFPGGVGTLDEVTEIICLNAINQIHVPCVIYNLDGYYRHLIGLFDDMKANGIIDDKRIELVKFADNLDDIKNILNQNN